MLSNKQRNLIFDNLVENILNYHPICEQGYTFFKTMIDKWQTAGIYDDAMLYFWYDEPIEATASIQEDSYRHFCQIMQNLGLKIPSYQDVLIINTTPWIDGFCFKQEIQDRKQHIINFLNALSQEQFYDIEEIKQMFVNLQEQGLLAKNRPPAMFNLAYQEVISQAKLWRQRHPKTKEQMFDSFNEY